MSKPKGNIPRDPDDPTPVPPRGATGGDDPSARAKRPRWRWSASKWIEAFLATRSSRKASETIGINVNSAYERRQVDEQFAKDWEEADKKRLKRMGDDLEETLYDRLLNGWPEAVPPFKFNKATGKSEPAGWKRVFDHKTQWQMVRALKAGTYLERVLAARLLDDLGVDPDAAIEPKSDEFL